jgi:hypothetical protein
VDCFDYEVFDPRNFACDNKYSYSIQQKEWMTFRYETNLAEIEELSETMESFNLDIIREALEKKSDGPTDTAKETYAKDSPKRAFDRTPHQNFEAFLRMGKMWAVVTERNEAGHPVKCSEGTDDNGDKKDGAELVNCFLNVALVNGREIMFRFQPNPFRDTGGKSYYPVVRGWCYIHPSKDNGMSDGKYLREIQIAMSDTLNMVIDRNKLSIMPTFQAKRSALDNMTEFYIEPEHIIEVENVGDIQEFRIAPDNGAGMNQIGMLKGLGEQVTAVFPTTMGQEGRASTTATAVAGAESRGNIRQNYKSLTFEFTFLNEFYWMILQMTHQFAMPETKRKMLGDLALDLDPDEDYSYAPVSSNIETEYNKMKKLQVIDQAIGRLSGLKNPKVPALLNVLMSMWFDLMGKEFSDIGHALLDPNAPPEGGEQVKDGKEAPTSNQAGQPQSLQEIQARAAAPGQG